MAVEDSFAWRRHVRQVKTRIPGTRRLRKSLDFITRENASLARLNEEVGYKREGNSPNFRDLSRMAMATNIVIPLYKPKNSLNFFITHEYT